MTAQHMLAAIAVATGVAGAVSAVPTYPPVQAILLLAFIVMGPGSAILCWLELPNPARIAGVIGVSLAVVTMLATSLAWLNVWYPVASCVAASVLVAAIGLVRLRMLRRRPVGPR